MSPFPLGTLACGIKESLQFFGCIFKSNTRKIIYKTYPFLQGMKVFLFIRLFFIFKEVKKNLLLLFLLTKLKVNPLPDIAPR